MKYFNSWRGWRWTPTFNCTNRNWNKIIRCRYCACYILLIVPIGIEIPEKPVTFFKPGSFNCTNRNWNTIVSSNDNSNFKLLIVPIGIEIYGQYQLIKKQNSFNCTNRNWNAFDLVDAENILNPFNCTNRNWNLLLSVAFAFLECLLIVPIGIEIYWS